MAKRPNLVNPENWSPFSNLPTLPTLPTLPIQQTLPIQPILPIQSTLPTFSEIKKQRIKQNSLFLNLFGIIILGAISYFLYSIYLERKIVTDYIQYVKNKEYEKSLFNQENFF